MITKYYSLGKIHFKLQFLSEIPIITPALKHLEVNKPDSIDFSVKLSENSQFKIPSTDEKNHIITYQDSTYLYAYEEVGEILSGINIKLNEGIYYAKDINKIPFWELGAPLRMLLHWFFQTKGFQLTHSAAVGTEKGALLIVGPGGSGKSTTALASLKQKMLYISDDYCLIDSDNHVHNIYCSAKVTPKTLDWFPEYQKYLHPYNLEKKVLFLDRKCITPKLPIKGIVVPKISSYKKSQIEKTTRGNAFRALAPSTLFQLVGLRNQAYKNLAELTKKLPCYQLNLGRDFDDIPKLLEQLI